MISHHRLHMHWHLLPATPVMMVAVCCLVHTLVRVSPPWCSERKPPTFLLLEKGWRRWAATGWESSGLLVFFLIFFFLPLLHVDMSRRHAFGHKDFCALECSKRGFCHFKCYERYVFGFRRKEITGKLFWTSTGSCFRYQIKISWTIKKLTIKKQFCISLLLKCWKCFIICNNL